jgi:hypothetical protein
MLNQVDQLINVLLDYTAREDERDDAAMDLGLYNDSRALSALAKVGINPNENSTVLDSCGESIAKIMLKQEKYDKELLDRLAAPAKYSAYAFIRETKPEWLNI